MSRRTSNREQIEAENARILIIVGMTRLIALGRSTHIIAGSTEVLFMVFSGQLGWTGYLSFALPTLAGNIVGGSLIFALISHAQVRSDVSRAGSGQASN
ncbi:MAG: hypothetical protein WCD66_11635 [Rhodanobacteraceae bacterium]